MLRTKMVRNKLLMGSLAAILLVGAGTALAAVRLSLSPPPGVSGTDANAWGSAVLTYVPGEDRTIVQVTCRGLRRDTEYSVSLSPDSAISYNEIGQFTAWRNGIGRFQAVVPGDQSGNMPVIVTLRAMGTIVLSGYR